MGTGPTKEKKVLDKYRLIWYNKEKKENKTMREYGITNYKTNENSVMFGRNLADAWRRSGYNPEEWEVYYEEYID